MRRGPRRVEAEEMRLWRHAMRDTLPLRAVPPSDAPPARPPERAPASVPPPVKKAVAKAPPAPPTPVLPPAAGRHATPAGLDANQYRRLAAGKVPIDAKLDLHGLTQDEAYRRLNFFLGLARRDGLRCVLVITGKGPGDAGVLKRNVPHWLTSPSNAARVLTYARAAPKHGGEGALYVLLRRAKDKKV